MPTYDYPCEACGHELELFQSMTEAPKKKCPKCKKLTLRRRIGTGGGILFKGSGFYLTDYRSDAYKSAAKAESGASEAPKTASDAPKPAGDAKATDGGKSASGTPAKKKPADD